MDVRDCLVIIAAIPTMIRDNIQETGDAEKKMSNFGTEHFSSILTGV